MRLFLFPKRREVKRMESQPSAISEFQMEKPKELTQTVAMCKWPRLTAHMICQSLGYFSPKAAANAILFYKQGRPFWCEWYCHMAQFRQGEDRNKILKEIGKETIQRSYEYRHNHKGYMSEYRLAIALVKECIKSDFQPHMGFASWF